MIFGDLVDSLLRRWYIVVIGFVGTGLLCLFIAVRVTPSYESTARVTLVPGTSTVIEGGSDNPLLHLNGLTLARDALVRSMGADDVRQRILDAYPGTDFTVDGDPTTSGPVIVVGAIGPSKAMTAAVVGGALEELPAQLAELQDDVRSPEAARNAILRLGVPTEPEVVDTPLIRIIGALVAAGVVGTLIVAGLIDGMIGTRARRWDET